MGPESRAPHDFHLAGLGRNGGQVEGLIGCRVVIQNDPGSIATRRTENAVRGADNGRSRGSTGVVVVVDNDLHVAQRRIRRHDGVDLRGQDVEHVSLYGGRSLRDGHGDAAQVIGDRELVDLLRSGRSQVAPVDGKEGTLRDAAAAVVGRVHNAPLRDGRPVGRGAARLRQGERQTGNGDGTGARGSRGIRICRVIHRSIPRAGSGRPQMQPRG